MFGKRLARAIRRRAASRLLLAGAGARRRRFALGRGQSFGVAPDRRRQQERTPQRLRAGIEIKLQPGWHTYWRYPGDSGVPPRFDFSGSDNVASVKVLYPAPHLFTDETGNTSATRTT